MKCPECQRFLSALWDAALPAETEARVREHLAGCAACTLVWREVEAVGPMLDRMATLEPLPGTAAAVLAEAARQRGLGGWLDGWFTAPLRPAFTVAWAGGGLAAGILLGAALTHSPAVRQAGGGRADAVEQAAFDLLPLGANQPSAPAGAREVAP